MEEDSRALQVLQKTMAESVTFVRAFDETRNVGHHETAVIAHTDDAEIWRERRKRVGGDFRTRRRNARNQCGLAGIRKAHEPHIREQLQVQAQTAMFARQSRLRLARCAVRRADEPSVAHPALAAACDEDAVAFVREIGGYRPRPRVVVFDVGDRTDGNRDVEIGAASARAIGPLARTAAWGFELGMEAEVDQRIEMRACDEIDGSAVAAIAAIRTAARYELLATETEGATSPIAGGHGDIDFVYKHSSVFGLRSSVYCLRSTRGLQTADRRL